MASVDTLVESQSVTALEELILLVILLAKGSLTILSGLENSRWVWNGDSDSLVRSAVYGCMHVKLKLPQLH